MVFYNITAEFSIEFYRNFIFKKETQITAKSLIKPLEIKQILIFQAIISVSNAIVKQTNTVILKIFTLNFFYNRINDSFCLESSSPPWRTPKNLNAPAQNPVMTEIFDTDFIQNYQKDPKAK